MIPDESDMIWHGAALGKLRSRYIKGPDRFHKSFDGVLAPSL